MKKIRSQKKEKYVLNHEHCAVDFSIPDLPLFVERLKTEPVAGSTRLHPYLWYNMLNKHFSRKGGRA
jgi:hypothetical protein